MKVAMIGHESYDLNLSYCLKNLVVQNSTFCKIFDYIFYKKLVVKMYILNTTGMSKTITFRGPEVLIKNNNIL